jgi:hypothetical protein
MRRRMALPLAAAVLTLPAALLTAGQASAAVPADKAQVLSSWTQTSAASYSSWLAASNNQGAWSAYTFDWTTDYCSTSPDNPLGFPFKTACARHDFGYRNYKKAGTFDANKARLDSMLYEDLKRVCNGYSGASKTACDGTAWTYYHAVDIFGFSAAVDGNKSAA